MKETLARSPQERVQVEQSQREVRRSYRISWVELKISTLASATNFNLVCEYYQPKTQPSPVILILPMAGGQYPGERYFARYFARRGFATVIVHRRKSPPQSRLEEINPWLVASVQDCQRTIDWVETRPELDASRIAIFGISVGGLKGTLVAALDQRVKAAVLGLAGSDLPYILAHSAEHKIARQRKEVLRERHLTVAELESHLREIIQCDPGQAAKYVDCRKVLLVLAAFDKVVPIKKGWELRAKLGKPETVLLPTGHYSTALAIPCIQRQALRFIRTKLAEQRFKTTPLRSPKNVEP